MKAINFRTMIIEFLYMLNDDDDIKIYHRKRWKSNESGIINIEERVNENGDRYWQIF